ncbi:MAG: hypothetical protein K2X04_03990 [Burkholderiales bacterium]|jgi:hypothetical protein|nr:hypothetical protein [Burkholderiales bacterium]
MFWFLLMLFLSSSVILGVCYVSAKDKIVLVNKKLVIWITCGILFLCAVLICANRAVMGLIFNAATPDVDFSQTIVPQYLQIFITDALYAALLISIYLFVRRKLKIPPPIFLVGLLVLSLTVYFPGIQSADGDNSYGQFLAHSYSDWQPPLFTIWWNIFQVKSATFVMNMLTYYGGLIYISYYLWKKNYCWQNDLLIIFCFNPLLFTQLAIVWKDIGFTGFFIDCVAIYLAQQLVKNISVKIGLWVVYFFCLFLAVGFRLNGVFAVLPMIALALNQIIGNKYRNNYKILAVSIMSLATVITYLLLNNSITYKIFSAEKLYPQTFVMLGDMAYIECNTNHEFKLNIDNFVTPNEDSRDNLCNEQIANQYNLDAMFNPWAGLPATLHTAKTEAEATQIKQEWIGALSNYPLVYLEYRAKFVINDLFFQYWYPTVQNNTIQKSLESIAHYQHYDMKFILSLFLLGATFAVLTACIVRKNYNLVFYLLLSNLLQLISYYFLIPAHAARYFFWNDISMLLAIILLADCLTTQCSKGKIFEQLDKVKQKKK